jgi:hypothetical protein
MKLIPSTQIDVAFVLCRSPITIDKRDAWGPAEGNFQQGPKGAFLKMASASEVSHLVQPKDDMSAPIGWEVGSGAGLFSKAPIWVDAVLPSGEEKKVETADGPITYRFDEPAIVCYNSDDDGNPNLNDGWVQKISALKKNYVYDESIRS